MPVSKGLQLLSDGIAEFQMLLPIKYSHVVCLESVGHWCSSLASQLTINLAVSVML